ncbi:MAG: F0F1 ATP synthase subunit delta [Candidatus Magasanikbacteria bacterium]|nr:F0F1 ATP synthase subunit delta [Candidatus Magasanikbacteria bacterium]
MPKLLPRHYAKILYNLTKEAKDVNAATKEFLQFIQDKHATKKLPAIIKEFEEYGARQEGIVTASVTVARQLPEKLVQETVEKILGSKARLKISTDAELLGGLKVKTSSHEYDASLKGQLQQLEKSLAQ